jgi:hypothetical protein
MVQDDPYIPTHWGKNQKGMQAYFEIDESLKFDSELEWLNARDSAVLHAEKLKDMGIHQQIVNRILEPWLWHTIIVTATEWSNFFHLRDNPEANPEIQVIARMMKEVMDTNSPDDVKYDGWHLPLIQADEIVTDESVSLGHSCKIFSTECAKKVSVGRCARVSYLTHDGKRDPSADVELHDRLLKSGHMSPFEHVASPTIFNDKFFGNLRGWISYRLEIPGEEDILSSKKS